MYTVFLIPLLLISFSLKTFSQYYTPAAIATINLGKQGYEGDFYLDTINKQHYIGLSNGELELISLDSVGIRGIVNEELDSVHGSIFAIWAEESGGLTANAFEWSYGNGDESQAAFGVGVPVKCELFAVGVMLFNGTAEVEVYKNGIATGAVSGTGGVGTTIATLTTPIVFNAGDNVNFRTLNTTGSTSGGKAVAWFRIKAKIPTFEKFNGTGAPSATIGNDGDEYLDVASGDLYIKESGAWGTPKRNIIGPPGTVTNRPVIQVTNTLSGNINTGNVPFTWVNTATGTHVTNNAGSFVVANDGVTVLSPGLYKVTAFQYQTSSTSLRNNAALRFTINGAVQNGFGANAYQRIGSGHDESTASFSKLMFLGSGDKVGIRNDRLAGTGTVVCPAGTLTFIIEQL